MDKQINCAIIRHMAKAKAKNNSSSGLPVNSSAKALASAETSAKIGAKRKKNNQAKARLKKRLPSAAAAQVIKFKDSDADGLLDAEEKILGTDPKKSDSDRDGLSDGAEVKIYGTDPLNSDTDGDGLKDGEEIKRGLNPKGHGLLKDLFIPGRHNNFKPRALHPKRIAFYSLSAVLFKVILAVSVMALPIEAWLTPDLLVEQSKKIISLTNTIRTNLNLAPLSESPLLDQAAFNKAQDMLFNQYFSHNGPDGKSLADWLKTIKYDFLTAGENLAMGFTSPEEVVNAWTRSQTHYKNLIDRDFNEIGVGIVSGRYGLAQTTLVAQYFGAALSQPAAAIKPAQASAPASAASNSRFAGDRINKISEPVRPKNLAIAVTDSPGQEVKFEPDPAPLIAGIFIPQIASAAEPLIDLFKSKLYVDQPKGQSQKVVRAEVYLSSAAAKARVDFNNYFIDLKPAAGEAAGGSAALAAGLWTGQTIIFEENREQIFNPVVLPILTVEDRLGNKTAADLDWDNIQPADTSLLKQYYFIKQHQAPYIRPLFNLTSIFYKVILAIALIALALNILIEIKKQSPRIILSTLGLIALLVVLIII